ncbi:hypothetical protein OSTOST_02691 [Ostertagia ostertagi]
MSLIQVVNFQEQFSISDVGRLYKIPKEEVEALGYKRMLPRFLARQYDTLDELVTMIREPLIEVSMCMNAVRQSFPALRLVLWGPFGTGKSVTLNQAVHLAYTKKMVVIQLWSAMLLTRDVNEVEMSTFKQGRINDPANAVAILQQFKEQAALAPMSLFPPYTRIALFVAIDDTNSLWGKTLVKKADRSYNQHVWKTLSELKTERDYVWTRNERTAVDKPITDIVEIPFLPIETKQYTKGEVSNMYQYYYDKRMAYNRESSAER